MTETTSDKLPENVEEDGAVFFQAEAVRGIPWLIVSKVILFFVYFGISVLVVRRLGPEKFGVYSLCKNIGEYLLIVCSVGMNAALLRFIPELVANRNKAGLKRLLWKSAAMQASGVIAITVLLYLLKPQFDRWFHVDFRYYLLLTALLIATQISKNYLNDVFTSFFKTRIVSIMSTCQGLLWIGLLAGGLNYLPDVQTPLLAWSISILLVSIVGTILLVRFFRSLNWRSPLYGIGKRRALKFSGANMLNMMARMLMLKYTEVFFLGACFSSTVVGIYELGYSLPQMVITFIPMAVQTLFVSGFSEAYSRDENCLPRLISAFYKMLIMMAVPLAAFGVFFVPRGIELIYGAKMAEAGPIAATFCIIHLLPLVSMPLSMAIIAKEKILNMFPILLMQIGVNLLLDFLLIPRFGVVGAMLAVAGTFFLTIPIRLYIVRRIVGGIYFPIPFLIRIAVPLFLLAWLLSPLAKHVNLALLLGVSVIYLLLYLVMIRLFRLVGHADVEDFRGLGISRMNKVLDLLVGKKK